MISGFRSVKLKVFWILNKIDHRTSSHDINVTVGCVEWDH